MVQKYFSQYKNIFCNTKIFVEVKKYLLYTTKEVKRVQKH